GEAAQAAKRCMTVAVPGGVCAPAHRPSDARSRRHAASLGGTWLALLASFHRDTAELATGCWTDPTFAHWRCSAPVIAWLVWQRGTELALVAPHGWWPGRAVVGAGGFAWLLGDAASVAQFRHLGLVVMLQGAVATLLGPNVAR